MRFHPTRTWAWALLLPLALMLVSVDDADAKRRKKKKNRFREASSISGRFLAAASVEESGRLEAWLSPARSTLELEFDDLQPGVTYAVTFDGMEVARVMADADDEAELEFEAPLSSGRSLPLDFDPRLGEIALKRSGLVILRFDAADTGAVRESLYMTRMPGAPPKASGTLVYASSESGTSLSLGVAGLTTGEYEVEVDGVRKETVKVVRKKSKKKKKRKRKRRTSTYGGVYLADASGLHLGQRVDVKAGGQTFLSTQLLAGAAGATPCTETEQRVFLARLSGTGSAKARYRTRKDCDEDFQVEVEDVPVGVYEVRVGGVVRGSLVAAFDAAKGQVEGEIEFDTDPDDPGEIPLTFDPRTASIEVMQGATRLFAGSLSGSAGGGAGGGGTGGGGTGGGPAGVCEELEVRRPMVNLGLASRASGDARRRVRDDCRRDFQVEVEDLPAGTYDLVVGGVRRGSLVVGPPLFEAELEFDSHEAEDLPLDFDPAGASIEVRQGGRVYLAVTLP